MLRFQVIGCGAAGNKATIDLVESEVLNKDEFSYLLINSTSKDIPANYREKALIFGKSLGGCGKERDIAKDMIIHDEDNGIRALDKMVDPYADVVIVCGSTEGGTGSASIPMISKYISSVLKQPVIACLFFGFNDDARGMQNSIEVCQELPENVGVISICNSKFLTYTNGNKLKAEELANSHFISIIRTLSGKSIYESSQNIDDTDLKKLITTPGYMTVMSANITGSKSPEQVEKKINDSFIDNKSMDSPSKSAKRIGVIFDVKQENPNADYQCKIFKDLYGTPYELFLHVQHVGSLETVTCIAAGQKMPIDEVKEIFEEYKRTSSEINKSRDEFFDTLNSFKGNAEDSMFNMGLNKNNNGPSEADRNAFFKEFGVDLSEKKPEGKTPVVKSVKEY